MTNNNYPNIKSLIISVLALFRVFNAFKEHRKKFTINALTLLSDGKGKVNFLQLQQFSEKFESCFIIRCIPKSVQKSYVWGSYRPASIEAVRRSFEFVSEEWIVRLNSCKICI